MLVGQILKAKAIAETVTIRPDMTVGEATELLSSRRIGAVIVASDPKRPEGILSERDIVRTLGREGGGCLDDTVEALMTRDLITCAKDETADDILAKMTQGRFRHMPVLEDGVLIGLISLGDVVKARLMELSMEKDALEGMIRGH